MYEYDEDYIKDEFVIEYNDNIIDRILHIIYTLNDKYEYSVNNNYTSINFFYNNILINFEFNSMNGNKLYLIYYPSKVNNNDIQKIKDIFYFAIKI